MGAAYWKWIDSPRLNTFLDRWKPSESLEVYK